MKTWLLVLAIIALAFGLPIGIITARYRMANSQGGDPELLARIQKKYAGKLRASGKPGAKAAEKGAGTDTKKSEEAKDDKKDAGEKKASESGSSK